MPKPTVYSRPSCVQCQWTKKIMEQEGIAYDEINVEEDAAALEFIKGLGYSAAPVVVAGNEHWSGFRPERIKGLNPRDVEA